ncbi:MAG: hypothetical protein WC966_09265 [Bradymonadales bacterium]
MLDTKVVIDEIRSKLNGEAAHDMAILQKYSQKYAESPDGALIIQEIGKIYLDNYADAGHVFSENISDELMQGLEDELRRIGNLAATGKTSEAIEGIEVLIKVAQEALQEQQEDSEFYSFETPVEHLIFTQLCPHKEDAMILPLLYDKLYYMYGSLLFEAGELAKSKAAFEAALRFNPVKVAAYFELGELAKLDNDLEELARLTKKAWEYSFLRMQLARCYRNYAHIALKQRKTRLAAALIKLSQDYQPSVIAERMRQSLQRMDPKAQQLARLSSLKNLLASEDIELGPHMAVYEALLQLAAATRNNDPELSLSGFELAYELTHYKPILDDIASLKARIAKSKDEAT